MIGRIIIAQNNLQPQRNPYQHPNGIFSRNIKNNIKIHVAPQKTPKQPNNLDKEEQS